MNLREHMTDAVDESRIDLDRLGSVARTQGTRLVRRRRAVMVGVPALVAVVVGVGAATLVDRESGGGREGSEVGYAESPSGSSGPDLAITTTATGPGAVAALRHAVGEVADGTTSDFSSQGPYGEQHNLSGILVLTSATTGIASSVQVSVSTGEEVPTGSLCGSMTQNCDQTTLPDGSVLLTSDTGRAADPGSLNRSATLWRPDGTLVTVGNDTGQDLPGHQGWGELSEYPSLTFDQLTEIARQPWWGETLPTTFVEEGRGLDVRIIGDFD